MIARPVRRHALRTCVRDCSAVRVALRDSRADQHRGLQSLKDDIKDKGGELAKMMECKHYTDPELMSLQVDLGGALHRRRQGQKRHVSV